MQRDGDSTRAGAGSSFEGFLYATTALHDGFRRATGVAPMLSGLLRGDAAYAEASASGASPGPSLSQRESAVQYAHALLRDEVLKPLLRAATPDDFTRLLGTKLARYQELMTSIHALIGEAAHQPAARSERDRQDAEQLVELVGRTMGEQARMEVDFAARTAVRCIAKAALVEPLSPGDPRTDQDRRLVERFHGSVVLYGLAVLLLGSLAHDPALSTESARACALELLRSGALGAYAAAAESLALRQPPDDDLSPLPWDEEDEALASDDG